MAIGETRVEGEAQEGEFLLHHRAAIVAEREGLRRLAVETGAQVGTAVEN
jgi:hypothetical protein